MAIGGATPGGYLERPRPSGLADVIDVILDKGLVIDAYVRVWLIGIEILTIDARIVIASVDTYLRTLRRGRRSGRHTRRQQRAGTPRAARLGHLRRRKVKDERRARGRQGDTARRLRGGRPRPAEVARASSLPIIAMRYPARAVRESGTSRASSTVGARPASSRPWPGTLGMHAVASAATARRRPGPVSTSNRQWSGRRVVFASATVAL
jgi:Gas vesicle protein